MCATNTQTLCNLLANAWIWAITHIFSIAANELLRSKIDALEIEWTNLEKTLIFFHSLHDVSLLFLFCVSLLRCLVIFSRFLRLIVLLTQPYPIAFIYSCKANRTQLQSKLGFFFFQWIQLHWLASNDKVLVSFYLGFHQMQFLHSP